MPRPLRCPMVNRCTPPCAPRVAPLLVENRPPRASASGSRRTTRSRRRARSRSPGCPACRRPQSEPARLGAHRRLRERSHRKHARASCSCVSENRKYDWSLSRSALRLSSHRPLRRARRARSGPSRPARRRTRARARAASRTSGRCCSARTAAASGPRRTRARSSRSPSPGTAPRRFRM